MGKFIDITGQKFNHLTVLSQLPNKGRRIMWKCQCDCGNIVEIRGDKLKCGDVKSCGCVMHRDLVGQKFHMLTVLSKATPHKTNDGRNRTYWNCVCDCGKKRKVLQDALIQNKTKSCGCTKFYNRDNYNYSTIDEVGNKYGRLTVLSFDNYYISPSGGKLARWLCRCDCGNIVSVLGVSLRSGHTQSCGCLTIDLNRKYNEFRLDENVVTMYTSDGYPFCIDKEDLPKVQMHCWSVTRKGYLTCCINGHSVNLHRYLVDCPDNMVVDHISGNPADNRKCNLRICTVSDNAKNRKTGKNNTSGNTGVHWHKKQKKWVAYIRCNNVSYWLGSFDSFELAKNARISAELQLHGDYSHIKSQQISANFEVI